MIILFSLTNMDKNKTIENYDGALTQLYAKGPQDSYLSGVGTTEVYPHGYYIGKYPYYRFHFNYVPYGFY